MREIQAVTAPELNLYTVLMNSTGQVYNGSGFVDIEGVYWPDCYLAMNEAIAGIYFADMPEVASGTYNYIVYGFSEDEPSPDDTRYGVGYLEWDGEKPAVPGGMNPAEIWGYPQRTLTVPVVHSISGLVGGKVHRKRGDTWEITVSGLNGLEQRTLLWCTAKANRDFSDINSLFQVSEDAGLLVLNKANSDNSEWGSLGVDEDSVILYLSEEATALFAPGTYYVDVQMRGDGIHTLAEYLLVVTPDVTLTRASNHPGEPPV